MWSEGVGSIVLERLYYRCVVGIEVEQVAACQIILMNQSPRPFKYKFVNRSAPFLTIPRKHALIFTRVELNPESSFRLLRVCSEVGWTLQKTDQFPHTSTVVYVYIHPPYTLPVKNLWTLDWSLWEILKFSFEDAKIWIILNVINIRFKWRCAVPYTSMRMWLFCF